MAKAPTTATPTMTIYQKLLCIQKEVLGLGKDKDSFSFKYVTGAKVLEHIKPLMNRYGLLLKQEIIEFDNTRMDYATKNANKSEILTKVTMKFTWIDTETGETDVNMFGANGQNDWEKGLGSALTYAERYFLLKYFHISTDEDDIDNPERKPQTESAPTPPPPPAPAPKVIPVLSDDNFKKALKADEKGIKATIDAIEGKRLFATDDQLKQLKEKLTPVLAN